MECMMTVSVWGKNHTFVLMSKRERKWCLFPAFKSRKYLYMITFIIHVSYGYVQLIGKLFIAFLLSDLAVCVRKHFYQRDLEWYLTVIHTKIIRFLVLEGRNHRCFALQSCRSHCIGVCYNDSNPSSDQEATLEFFYSATYWMLLG